VCGIDLRSAVRAQGVHRVSAAMRVTGRISTSGHVACIERFSA
jgi:hypothetical protein